MEIAGIILQYFTSLHKLRSKQDSHFCLFQESPKSSQSCTTLLPTPDIIDKELNNSKSPILPNQRALKSRWAKKHSDFIKTMPIKDNKETLDVVILSLNRLALTKTHIIEALIDKPSNIKCGRKLTPLDTRKQVWNYWHNKSTHSTLTSRPAKLKITDRCKIQSDLELVDTTNIIVQRGKQYYESNWKMVNIPYEEMYHEYLPSHSEEHHVSYGSFIALEPFYVQSATQNDIEMCCCKVHLHARS